MIMSTFRDNLKAELTFQGILVKELAERTGISKRTIDNYLAEKSSEPLAEAACKIAKALNVSVEYLVTGREDKVYYSSLKPEVLQIIPTINHLQKSDLELVSSIISRFTKSK